MLGCTLGEASGAALGSGSGRGAHSVPGPHQPPFLPHSEGSNLTPAHHFQDFRFKTYAPVAFRYFRELFGIRPDDYLVRAVVSPLLPWSARYCRAAGSERHETRVSVTSWFPWLGNLGAARHTLPSVAVEGRLGPETQRDQPRG